MMIRRYLLFFYYNIILNLFLKRYLIKSFCILAYLSPIPEFQDTYFIVVLGGDCIQYTFTSEYLEELSHHVIKMEDLNWSILAKDSTLDYKIIEVKEWKNKHIFTIIEEGKWENWIDEIKENIKKE